MEMRQCRVNSVQLKLGYFGAVKEVKTVSQV